MFPRRTQAKRYNNLKVRLKLADIVFLVFYLVLFQIFLSGHLKGFAFSFTPNIYCAFSLYLVAFSLLYYAIDFPLHFYSGFVLEHKFRLSNQSVFNWFKDDLKKGGLSLFIFLIFIHILYLLLRNFHTTWWIWIALFWFIATIFIAKISPVFIMPLFFKYYPVKEELKKKVIELSEKCNIKILDVYKIDFSKKTNKLNAAVVGLGNTRRVILADNLIQSFNEEEIEGVLAHEFAHHKLRHMWKLLFFALISISFSFYALYLVSLKIVILMGAANVYDIKIFPVFMLILFMAGFLISPLENAFSRSMERQSDLFALKVTQNKNAFISLMKKLADKNLSDPDPPKIIKYLFYDHPPIQERIKLAEGFK